MIDIKAGLNLPIKGSPRQELGAAPATRSVALLGSDYPGMKPTMLVREGDRVKLGQPVFTDKKNEGVVYTAPGAGVVTAIHRGERRVFQALVIELDSEEEQVSFTPISDVTSASREAIVNRLVESGLWTAIRKRPFDKVPAIESVPHSIFVNAMDTHPLAGDPMIAIARHAEAFAYGLSVLRRLTDGPVHVCTAVGTNLSVEQVTVTEFSGPHPAGLVGTHIHHLDPIGEGKEVWHLNAQDVI
ncbi:MAG: NADH:ubiquinone reductase (Na(+)-transporting) subunit A, partial [Gammaproteobacteria bacterium]|nr:NADH:ubiquinone reductase (Na(+)-transporting) subunit A [Gammaproteobacteria bacterium]